MTDTSRPSLDVNVPSAAMDAVLVASKPVPEGSHPVSGVDFDRFQGRDITVAEMVDNMTHMGFQGSTVAEAVQIINDMVRAPESSLLPTVIPWLRSLSFSRLIRVSTAGVPPPGIRRQNDHLSRLHV